MDDPNDDNYISAPEEPQLHFKKFLCSILYDGNQILTGVFISRIHVLTVAYRLHINATTRVDMAKLTVSYNKKFNSSQPLEPIICQVKQMHIENYTYGSFVNNIVVLVVSIQIKTLSSYIKYCSYFISTPLVEISNGKIPIDICSINWY